jgi:hypothetical protein
VAAEIQTAYEPNYSRQIASSIVRIFVNVPLALFLTVSGAIYEK